MRLLIFFLLLSLCAEASNAQIIRANPFYKPTAAAATFLLDEYPNAAAAYSLRKLKSSYSGSAIRIRRDSTGNAETDIGFTANGDLDTAAIKTHCRNNSCMVTTWYNQGDSTAVNFTQTTAASQPRIMTSGVIERQEGEPSIRFDNSGTRDFMDVASSTQKFAFLHQSGVKHTFLVLRVDNVAGQTGVILDNRNISTIQIGFTYLLDNASGARTYNAFVGNGSASVVRVTATILLNNLYLFTNKFDNGNATANQRHFLYLDGTQASNNNSASATPSSANASNSLRMGAPQSAGNALNGFVSELILYPTDQSSNRTGIETNINNYYGLW